jgi:DNA-binding transcriptional MerR regulator
MTPSWFEPLRGLKEMKIDDLVDRTAAIVPRLAGPQGRHKVAPIPDARTIRYYIREGLVDPPHGSAGSAALYGYRHLLQLVAVKVLQSHYLPIRKIRETIEDLTDRELESLIESWARDDVPPPVGVTEDEAGGGPRRYLDLVATSSVSPPAGRDAKSVLGEAQSATAYLESLDRVLAAAPRAGMAGAAGPPRVAGEAFQEKGAQEPGGWTRHELHPGIELHVRQGIRIPISPSFLSALASRMKSILEKLIARR